MAFFSVAFFSPAAARHLLYDIHGSTRAILDAAAAVTQQYGYTAYGEHLTGTNLTAAAAALTRLLYSGEFTAANGTQYLRARWYNPSTGTFNRLDPYEGNTSDPLSLNKYLYTHGNPVMGIDPSGLIIATLTNLLYTAGLRLLVLATTYGPAITQAAYYSVQVAGGIFAASTATKVLIDWGYLPQSWSRHVEAIQYYSGAGFVIAAAIFTASSAVTNLARPPRAIPRLQRDAQVSGNRAPGVLPARRPVARNPFINAEKDRDVLRLQDQGAVEIRVDQRQVQSIGANGSVQRGLNRPDTQGIFPDRTISIEYDTNLEQLLLHRDRILANDSSAQVILKWFAPNSPNYTIIP